MLGEQAAVGGAVRVEGAAGRPVLAQMHGSEASGVGRRQHVGEPGAGRHEVRAQQIAEVVVGDAGKQRRGDSEAAETSGDVEAGATRARLVGRGAVGRTGGCEVHRRVSGDDHGRLACGFRSVRSGTHAGLLRDGGGSRGLGLFGTQPLTWPSAVSVAAGGGGAELPRTPSRDDLTIGPEKFSRKIC